MSQIKPKQDIVPLSEFRANVSELLDRARKTGRPIVITQRGRGAAVLISTEEYEAMLDRAEQVRSIERGMRQLAAGKAIPHRQAVATFKRTIAGLKRKASA